LLNFLANVNQLYMSTTQVHHLERPLVATRITDTRRTLTTVACNSTFEENFVTEDVGYNSSEFNKRFNATGITFLAQTDVFVVDSYDGMYCYYTLFVAIPECSYYSVTFIFPPTTPNDFVINQFTLHLSNWCPLLAHR
jgi:hypothetical protein